MALQCPYENCQYTWEPRVINPKACPSCKRHFDEDHKPIAVDTIIVSVPIPKVPIVKKIKQDPLGLIWCEINPKHMNVHLAMYEWFGKSYCLMCFQELLSTMEQVTTREILHPNEHYEPNSAEAKLSQQTDIQH